MEQSDRPPPDPPEPAPCANRRRSQEPPGLPPAGLDSRKAPRLYHRCVPGRPGKTGFRPRRPAPAVSSIPERLARWREARPLRRIGLHRRHRVRHRMRHLSRHRPLRRIGLHRRNRVRHRMRHLSRHRPLRRIGLHRRHRHWTSPPSPRVRWPQSRSPPGAARRTPTRRAPTAQCPRRQAGYRRVESWRLRRSVGPSAGAHDSPIRAVSRHAPSSGRSGWAGAMLPVTGCSGRGGPAASAAAVP